MRNSLILKLMGAFLLVIAIGALVISWLVSQATQSAFNLYTTRSGQAWAQRLAPLLGDYYLNTGSWQGVDGYIRSGMMGQVAAISTQAPAGRMGPGRGMGAMQTSGEPWSFTDQRVILADARGVVVSDTEAELLGRQVPPADLKNGTAVSAGSAQVGTLIISPLNVAESGTPAGEFLSSVNQAILSSMAIAGGIALVLGALLFFQITAPLRQLKTAAAAIARGDLRQRVDIRSRDEFGELGATFNHMAESLSQAEIQRQHLVADVAHELRTPLAAMLATIEGMQDGVLPLDDEQVAALHSETLLLNRLIGDLRLLSLAEAGQLKLEQRAVPVAEWLPQVVDRLRPQADPRGIRLQTNLADSLPEAYIDPDRITQVLTNLVGNALRYTPEGGLIEVSAAQAGGFIQVAVTDTGAGIAPEALPYIFDRFYRADKSRSRASGGSGLGLAIVRQLVEAHGGAVQALSPVPPTGGGTRISFTVPIMPR